MHATPKFEFPFKQQIQESINNLQYLQKLMIDFEEFVNQGLAPEFASELIKTMHNQHLTSEDFR